MLYAAVLSQVAVIGIIYGEDSSRTHNTQFFSYINILAKLFDYYHLK